jgi:replicative DNA helicase
MISDVFQKNKLDYSFVMKIIDEIEYEYNSFDMYLQKYIKYYSEQNTKLQFDRYKRNEITLEELQNNVEKNVLIKNVKSKKCNAIDIIQEKSFEDKDEYIDIGIPFFQNGFGKEELIIIAARPGVGKTTLMRNWNIKAGIKKITICIYELEVPKKKYVKQLVCLIAQVNYEMYSMGLLNENEKKRVEDAKYFFEKRLVIVKDMTDGINDIDAMKLDMKNMIKKYGIQMFFVDYLQLVRCRHGQKRNEQVGYISNTLKSIAATNLTPVIALAQLNREIENRANPEPRLSDLKDSGDIEQDADTIMFLNDVEIPGKYTSRIKHSVIKRRNGNPDCYFSNFEKNTGFMSEIEVKR